MALLCGLVSPLALERDLERILERALERALERPLERRLERVQRATMVGTKGFPTSRYVCFRAGVERAFEKAPAVAGNGRFYAAGVG